MAERNVELDLQVIRDSITLDLINNSAAEYSNASEQEIKQIAPKIINDIHEYISSLLTGNEVIFAFGSPVDAVEGLGKFYNAYKQLEVSVSLASEKIDLLYKNRKPLEINQEAVTKALELIRKLIPNALEKIKTILSLLTGKIDVIVDANLMDDNVLSAVPESLQWADNDISSNYIESSSRENWLKNLIQSLPATAAAGVVLGILASIISSLSSGNKPIDLNNKDVAALIDAGLSLNTESLNDLTHSLVAISEVIGDDFVSLDGVIASLESFNTQTLKSEPAAKLPPEDTEEVEQAETGKITDVKFEAWGSHIDLNFQLNGIDRRVTINGRVILSVLSRFSQLNQYQISLENTGLAFDDESQNLLLQIIDANGQPVTVARVDFAKAIEHAENRSDNNFNFSQDNLLTVRDLLDSAKLADFDNTNLALRNDVEQNDDVVEEERTLNIVIVGSGGANIRSGTSTNTNNIVLQARAGAQLVVTGDVVTATNATLGSRIWFPVELQDENGDVVTTTLNGEVVPVRGYVHESTVGDVQELTIAAAQTPEENSTNPNRTETPTPAATEAPIEVVTVGEMELAVEQTPTPAGYVPATTSSITAAERVLLISKTYQHGEVTAGQLVYGERNSDGSQNLYYSCLNSSNGEIVLAPVFFQQGQEGSTLLFIDPKTNEGKPLLENGQVVEEPETVTIIDSSGQSREVTLIAVPENLPTGVTANRANIEEAGFTEASLVDAYRRGLVFDAEGNAFYPVPTSQTEIYSPVFIQFDNNGIISLFAIDGDGDQVGVASIFPERAPIVEAGAFATLPNGDYSLRELVTMGLDFPAAQALLNSGNGYEYEVYVIDEWEVGRSDGTDFIQFPSSNPDDRTNDGTNVLNVSGFESTMIVSYIDSNGQELQRQSGVRLQDIDCTKLLIPITYDQRTNGEGRTRGWSWRVVSEVWCVVDSAEEGTPIIMGN